MSRLFEALSEMEMKRGSAEATPRHGASPENVASATSALSVVLGEPASNEEINHRPSKGIHLSEALSDVLLPEETTSDIAIVEPPQTIEAVRPSSVVVPEAVGLPETSSRGRIGLSVGGAAAATAPARIIETRERLPQEQPVKPVPPVIVPASTTATGSASPERKRIDKVSVEVPPTRVGTFENGSVAAMVSPNSRLVALTEPNSLGAEKFRALVTRIEHLRKQKELRSFQVTSSIFNEGKTLVASNVAATFAKYSGARTLLIEGDLHRPMLSSQLGLNGLRGLTQWWASRDQELSRFVYRLNDLPLWFLPTGSAHSQPSDILSSPRFAQAFAKLAGQFDWVVVDSPPMQPIVDVNLWSKLVDGTLLVVREGVAPIKVLKSGLKALDHPKLIGVVLNDASGDQAAYEGKYYGGGKPSACKRKLG